MRPRDQHRRYRISAGDVERCLGQAQQEIRPRRRAALEFAGIGGIDAHFVPGRLQRAHAILKMRKRRIGQAAEIDHIGALSAHLCRAAQDFVDGDARGIDDLAENADVVVGEIRWPPAAAEKGRQVGNLVRPALDFDAEFARQRIDIGAAAAWQDDPVGLDRARHAAQDDRFRHQCGDLHPDIENAPGERRRAEAVHRLDETRRGEMSGQKQDTFGHTSLFKRAARAGPESARAKIPSALPARRPARQ